MALERRIHERKTLSRNIPGAFFIDFAGRSHPFTNVCDVSISGMGVALPAEIPSGAEVSLRYESVDFNMNLRGTIAWVRKSNGSAENGMGINFATDDIDRNVMFFMTLREYIDDFDERF